MQGVRFVEGRKPEIVGQRERLYSVPDDPEKWAGEERCQSLIKIPTP